MANTTHLWAVFVAACFLGCFGLIVLFAPTLLFGALLILFAGGFIWSGIVNIMHYGSYSYTDRASTINASGLVSSISDLVIGCLFLFNFLIPVTALPYVIGAYFIAWGIIQLFCIYGMSRYNLSVGSLVFQGIAGIIYGLVMLFVPQFMVFGVGLFMITKAGCMIYSAFADPTGQDVGEYGAYNIEGADEDYYGLDDGENVYADTEDDYDEGYAAGYAYAKEQDRREAESYANMNRPNNTPHPHAA